MTLRTLFDEDRLAARVRELAAEIRVEAGDAPLLAVVVLKGAFVFAADLLRAMWPHDVAVDFVAARSYEGTESSGAITITHDVTTPIEGRHVLLVEDILDTGLTLSTLVARLRERHPASLRVAVLLDKPSRRKVPFEADHVGFTIPDLFVLGYGLDLDQRYRNLPVVAVREA